MKFNDDIDMNTCFITGISSGIIERHHVIGQAYRTKSTFYGFVVPLQACIHPNGARRSDKECLKLTGKTTKEIDLHLKQCCQLWYELNLGKTRQEWINEFGKNYL